MHFLEFSPLQEIIITGPVASADDNEEEEDEDDDDDEGDHDDGVSGDG
jgi:hypothetical protein